MPKIIASTYEIKEKIGSGGAGIVYLGEHIRLNKPVVLKADKRTLSTKAEVLRQEVDALKNLSHTYIPQVYDFVAEGDIVYTVMDYIEGESLDKPLKRGERFSQVQVIEWACQLLEALCYLHSRPPHGILHSDIKPANIMVTPQGDIRLIDFNIALALGESGTVQVGYSRGYASPEHYGLDYSSKRAVDEEATELLDGGPTLLLEGAGAAPRTEKKERGVLLDVRSDIYSLGATLYHLLTGVRPAQDAREVEAVSAPDISAEIAAIIRKSMEPDPDRRYQTAGEMLDAFRRLHENDPRTLRHRRRSAVLSAVFLTLFLAGGLCTMIGLKQTQEAEAAARLLAEQAEEAERAAKTALAAVTEAEAAYAAGDIPGAVGKALEALSLESPYAAQAQRALTDALGVYDLSGSFRSHLRPLLPSEPLKLVLSPKGTRAAVMTLGRLTVLDTERGGELASLAAEPSALSDAAFLDEDRVVYAGEGGLRAYDLARGQELWSGERATALTLSADGSTAAAVYRDESLVSVYSTADGTLRNTVDLGGMYLSAAANDVYMDPEDDLFVLNGDGTLLAVGAANGGLMIYDLRERPDHLTVYEQSDFTHFQGGFYGRFLAYSAFAAGTGENVFGVIDTQAKEMIGGFTGDTMPYYAWADESGIYLSNEDVLVRLNPETGEQTELAFTAGADITGYALNGSRAIVRTAQKTVSVYEAGTAVNTWEEPCTLTAIAGEFAAFASGDAPYLRLVKLDDRADARLCTYDPQLPHSEARISGDGKTAMLFQFDRFFLYDMLGTLLVEVSLPEPREIYDQQFRRENGESRLDVIYNDGLVRSYSAADGRLLSETPGEKPDGALEEEFLTDALRIVRPLHGTPLAYSRESGEELYRLEPEDYLTYVTQVGDCIITEYMDGQGGRYGLLLDGQCRTLARMPDLCDVLEDGTLVFDDYLGNLRASRIYSVQELIALGETYKGGIS